GRLAGSRGFRECNELGTSPAIGSPHEQNPAVRDRADLLAQALLDLVGETAACEGVPRPETPVLDQEPVVDPAGGRYERLIVLASEIRAERRARPLRQPASCVTRQMTWPVVTGWPGCTESSETVPARGDVISFSIFIASTTQTTWPGSTASPSTTSTASTVPCIGVTMASRAAPWWPCWSSRSRRRRASSACGGSGSRSVISKRRPSTSAWTFRPRRRPSEATGTLVVI